MEEQQIDNKIYIKKPPVSELELERIPVNIDLPLIPDEEEKYEAQIDEKLKFLSGDNSCHSYSNLKEVEIRCNLHFYNSRLIELKEEAERVKNKVTADYNSEAKTLGEKLSENLLTVEIDPTGKSPSMIQELKEEANKKSQEWIKLMKNKFEQQKLEKINSDHLQIDALLNLAIQKCQLEIKSWEFEDKN